MNTAHTHAPAFGAHTPRDWRAADNALSSDHTPDHFEVMTRGGGLIAQVFYGRSVAEMQSNARLIAAAPDLLAALVAVAEDSRLVCNLNTGEKHYPITPEQMGEIRAAIARAKGQP